MQASGRERIAASPGNGLAMALLACLCCGLLPEPSARAQNSSGSGSQATNAIAPTNISFAHLAGCLSGYGYSNGTGAAAHFNSVGGLAADASGNVYVSDTNQCTIRRITPDGIVTTIAGTANVGGNLNGPGAGAAFAEPAGLAADPAGNIYVADWGNGEVRRIDQNGVVSALVPRSALSGPVGVAVDGQGNVFVEDGVTQQSAETYTTYALREITSTGALGTLPVSPLGFSQSFGADQAGNVYFESAGEAMRLAPGASSAVAVPGLGTGYSDVFAVGPDGTVGRVTISYPASGGVLSQIVVYRPGGIVSTFSPIAGSIIQFAFDAKGNAYAAVAGGGQSTEIEKITPGDTVSTIAGGFLSSGSADGPGAAAQFAGPAGVAVDGSGTVYVADAQNATIRKVVQGTVTTLAGSAGQTGHVDATGGAARLLAPTGIVVGPAGDLFVSDNDTIRRVTAGGVVTTLAGLAGVPGTADGAGTSARFSLPAGLAVDPAGNVYVADRGSHTIRKVTPGGMVTTLAGTAGQHGSSNGSGTGVLFDDPVGVVVAAGGVVYVLETNEDLQYSAGDVRKILPDGSVYTFASAAIKSTPSIAGIAIDSDGNLYVTNPGYNGIQIISSGGSESAIGGNVNGFGGDQDGTGTGAFFSTPGGIAVDASGTVYVADTGNNAIRVGTPYHYPYAPDLTAAALLGGTVAIALPGTDSPGNTLTYALTAVDGGTAVLLGSEVRFTPSATGVATLSYQASDGFATSDTGTVTVTTSAIPPSFTRPANPASITVTTGRSVAFTAAAGGAPTPTYQWTLNGSTTIPGAVSTTDPILLIPGVTQADAGTYTCTATNSAGAATSLATLAVAASPTAGQADAYLSNLSGRGWVGAGPGNAVFGGLNLGGSGSKNVFLRGVGPGLVPLIGSAPALPDPILTLFDGSSHQLARDQVWGGLAAFQAAEAIVGAFAVPTSSLDSMLLETLAAGGFTIQLTSAGGSNGVALAEAYDADLSPANARLTNVSVRAPVAPGPAILIGGFVVGGSNAETVLIRAVGPGLPLTFGLTGILEQPVLIIYDAAQNVVGSNTGWNGDRVAAAAAAAVGAFSIPSWSADSAVLVTLPPGAYSATVSGVSDGAGIALVEIYELY